MLFPSLEAREKRIMRVRNPHEKGVRQFQFNHSTKEQNVEFSISDNPSDLPCEMIAYDLIGRS